MTRKLLPYEYELIEVLGVSKEEYLDFVAQQHIYKDIKEGSALDTVNGPLTPALVTRHNRRCAAGGVNPIDV
jgi:hypothetical protein